jgi:hypothetical protein
VSVTPPGHTPFMTSNHPAGGPKPPTPKQKKRVSEPTQLRLLDGGRTSRKAWQLDARTRRIGRQRVAEAREILRQAQPPEPGSHHQIAG